MQFNMLEFFGTVAGLVVLIVAIYTGMRAAIERTEVGKAYADLERSNAERELAGVARKCDQYRDQVIFWRSKAREMGYPIQDDKK